MVYGALTSLDFKVYFNFKVNIIIILKKIILYFTYIIKVWKKLYKLKEINIVTIITIISFTNKKASSILLCYIY